MATDTAPKAPGGYDNFLDALHRLGGITREEAAKVCAEYRRLRVLHVDRSTGHYSTKHGAFLDRDVIRRALAESPEA